MAINVFDVFVCISYFSEQNYNLGENGNLLLVHLLDLPYPKMEMHVPLFISVGIVSFLSVIRFHANDLSILREKERMNYCFRFITISVNYMRAVGGICGI